MLLNSTPSIETNTEALRAAASLTVTVTLISCHMGAAYGSV